MGTRAGEIEAWLCTQIAARLDRPPTRIDPHVRFERYGLSSAEAIMLCGDLELWLGRRLRPSLVWEHPTAARLAAHLADELTHADAPPRPPSTPRPIPTEIGDHPLSLGQRALYLLHQLAPDSLAYNVGLAVQTTEPLDESGCARAVQFLVSRHSALRATFRVVSGELVQRIRATPAYEYDWHDAASVPEETIRARIAETMARGYDLERGPLLRVGVWRRAQDAVLLLVTHHIVTDGWSLALLVDELIEHFRSNEQSSRSTPASHLQLAAAERARLESPEGERLLRYWSNHLRGAPGALELPIDRPRPPAQTFNGDTVWDELDGKLLDELTGAAEHHHASRYTILLAAFCALLHRHSGQRDLIVGSLFSGRTQRAHAGTIGYLTNPLPLRVSWDDDDSFADLVATVRRTVSEAADHQGLPFPALVAAVGGEGNRSRAPLFQVMFNWNPVPRIDPALEIYPLSPLGAQFDLTLGVQELNGRAQLAWIFNTDLFDRDRIERMARHFQRLLAGALQRPDTPIARLPLLPDEERERLLITWNQTDAVVPALGLQEMFEAQVRRTPDHAAVSFEDRRLSYAELNAHANRWARRLRAAGVKPNGYVGVFMERSLELVVSLIAVLKSGGAYVPLEPSDPPGRRQAALEDTGFAVVLTQAHLVESLGLGVPHVCVVCLDEPLAGSFEDNPEPLHGDAEVVYTMYTSGSTGRPKGVMIPHAALRSHLLWCQRELPLSSADRVLQKTPFTFDVSVLEVFTPLLAGAELVVAQPNGHRDARYLIDLIRERRITCAYFVPSMFEAFLEQPSVRSCTSLRRIACGGEELERHQVRRCHERLDVELFNLYGPTETAIFVTYWRCAPGEEGRVPIGRPISNAHLYVLDAALEPTPIGVPGEIFIGGLPVALGYLRRPELTRERFVPDPFSARPGARLYRSGDVGRFRSDGAIEFCGRVDDQQVKIRGFRVELGEIEAALAEHPAVSACAASTHGNGERVSLVAYVVPHAPRPGIEELRRFLSERLPAYMVPAYFVYLDALPVSGTGKLARAALPPPESDRPDALEEPFIAPRSDAEKRVAALWQEILKLRRVGIRDDFFALGGDSLQALELAAKLSDLLDRLIDVRFVLAYPTVEDQIRFANEAPPPVAQSPVCTADDERFDSRPLATLILTGELPGLDAAALAAIPSELAGAAGGAGSRTLRGLVTDFPLLHRIYATPQGRVGVIMLPILDSELYGAPDRLHELLVRGLRFAGRLGARSVSLTGLLPSATDHGAALQRQAQAEGLPGVTTGHATTAAAVVLNLRHALERLQRAIAEETLGVIGLGSIGLAALRLALQRLPHPREIVLCDLGARRTHLEQVADELRGRFGFDGPIRRVEASPTVPGAFHVASLVIGASSMPGVLDVRALNPGTILLDDSAPHCFDPQQALARAKAAADVIIAEAGSVSAAHPIPQTVHLPVELPAAAAHAIRVGVRDEPRRITGCVLSPLLSLCDSEAAPSAAPVELEQTSAHYDALCRQGYGPAAFRCGELVWTDEQLDAFRDAR